MMEVSERLREQVNEVTQSNGSVWAEMPKYVCHKQVWALKIKAIAYDSIKGMTKITPDDLDYAPFNVEQAWMAKHQPVVGGYYVVYADGYSSFSPAKAFEDGYTRIKGGM